MPIIFLLAEKGGSYSPHKNKPIEQEVSPAAAGMIPYFLGQQLVSDRFSRECGDDSASMVSATTQLMVPQRMRGQMDIHL
jgi:hypothetical protein